MGKLGMPVSATRRQTRFGPFTLDLAARELRQGNGRIRLQGVPFQILTILVERPGEWVTRDELRQRLWPADTFVDFDHCINTGIGKLRRALGDVADEPRYIETLPRYGYRLVVPLEQDTPAEPVPAAKNNIWTIVVPTAVVVFGTLIAAWLYYSRYTANADHLTDKDTIVLADVDNKTGDEVFDEALKQALAVELGQSPFLNVLSDQKVKATLGMMGRPTNERITADTGRELCMRAGSKALLIATISRLGSHYVVGVNALACATGATLVKEQGEAATKEDVLQALSRVCSSIRSKLGESLSSIEKFDVPVEATTSSLEALKYFSIGLTVRRREGDSAGVPFLRRAIELDPNFASAYSELGLSYDNLAQPSRALEYAAKAYQLRDRATERERLSISALYFNATGELNKEIRIYELWSADYPRSPVPHANLGADYAMIGQFDKALVEQQEALPLASDNVNIYTSLGATYLFLNRFDEAKAVFDQALARKLDDGGLRQYMYYLAFFRGDAARMEEELTWAAGKPGDEDLLLSLQSDTEASYGRMSKAREFSRRAVESAIRADSKETAAAWQVNAALREAEVGNAALARQGVRAALALSSGRDVKVQAAMTLARAGDLAQAKALSAELAKSYPTNLLLQAYWLPSINASIELSHGNSSGALASLETAAPYDLAGGLPLYPLYARGQAYLLAHNGNAAVAEFQKLLDHRAVAENFLTGSLASLQLARAYAMAGDTPKAKAAYQNFFHLWKDADADVPILNQAKTEYRKLR